MSLVKNYIRIWFYPFKSKFVRQMEDFRKLNHVSLLSKHHLDILVDDSVFSEVHKKKCDEFLKKVIEKNDTITEDNNKWKIIVFVHKSTEKTDVVNYFNDKSNDDFLLKNKIVYLDNGNAQNSENYKALEACIQLYEKCDEEEPFKGKGKKINNFGDINFKEENYTALPLSSPEQTDKWDEFLPKLENIKNHSGNYNIWAFTRNFEQCKLHKIEDESSRDYFIKVAQSSGVDDIEKRLIRRRIKTCIEPNTFDKQKASLILSPGNLQDENYRDTLISEIINNDVFGLKDYHKKINGETKNVAFRPLIIICNRAGEAHLLNNSSIWYRCIGIEDEEETLIKKKEVTDKIFKGKNEEGKKEDIQSDLKNLIKFWFENLFKKGAAFSVDFAGYDNTNAKESLDYNLRIHNENFLNKFGNGHTFITPKIYHNELQCQQQILDINKEVKFDDKGKAETATLINATHLEIAQFHKATFRILLIDDKIEGLENKGNMIQKLMSLDVFGDGKKEVGRKTVWNDDLIEVYQYDKFENDRVQCKDGKSIYEDNKLKTKEVQIIQATNLADAILLLANEHIKFDLVMMDYLLEKKNNDPNDRELATNFFEWVKDKKGENNDLSYLREQLKANKEKFDEVKNEADDIKVNRFFIDTIVANRGPLNKLWIFPITAFNDTFIQDLVNRGIRLIDYYWHISKGADPITTPYLFLRQLNSFLYLQLENAVFTESDIKGFLRKTIRKLEGKADFQAVMGSDYTAFINFFMMRATIDKDRKANSLFAQYIWGAFYKGESYKKLFVLINFIHKFYHRCAFGTKADYKKMLLFLNDIEFYIQENFSAWENDVELDFDVMKACIHQLYNV